MLELALKSLAAYLLGALMGALILGSFTGVDIRTQGSGNAGGTNALRTQGKAFALGVVAIDLFKGWCAVVWVPALALPGTLIASALPRDWIIGACAIAAVLGHLYPVWFDFRGGKGAATALGVVMGVAPLMLAPVALVWLVVLLLTGFVGLATILAVSALPLVAAAQEPASLPWLATTLVIAAAVIYAHRGNITRMLDGTEARARRLWLFRPRSDRSP
jgi:glycerol-3-phosphate acyltransferase PlsY